jgi:hypothetical protein
MSSATVKQIDIDNTVVKEVNALDVVSGVDIRVTRHNVCKLIRDKIVEHNGYMDIKGLVIICEASFYLSKDEILERMSPAQRDWHAENPGRKIYMVLEGMHRLVAFRMLTESDPAKWPTWRFRVVINVDGYSLPDLQNLAAAMNEASHASAPPTFLEKLQFTQSLCVSTAKEYPPLGPAERILLVSNAKVFFFHERHLYSIKLIAANVVVESAYN